MEFNGACLMAILVVFSSVGVIYASDPDILTDFTIPAVAAEFPALNGLGVSMAVLQFLVGGVNPHHTHPCASELLYLVDGSLLVGVVDTTGKMFTQNLTKGDLFVFPKGLLYYQLNMDAAYEALAISAFGSANAGTVSVPSTLFTTGIPDDVLAKSFKTNKQTIELLKGGLKST
ncbi:hypothetical protein SUGI_1026760 [Cryptomeria japonica]|nr:hypothetical protein SUGI_1026760 [Cryptomeria japonica]